MDRCPRALDAKAVQALHHVQVECGRVEVLQAEGTRPLPAPLAGERANHRKLLLYPHRGVPGLLGVQVTVQLEPAAHFGLHEPGV